MTDMEPVINLYGSVGGTFDSILIPGKMLVPSRWYKNDECQDYEALLPWRKLNQSFIDKLS